MPRNTFKYKQSAPRVTADLFEHTMVTVWNGSSNVDEVINREIYDGFYNALVTARALGAAIEDLAANDGWMLAEFMDGSTIEISSDGSTLNNPLPKS